MRPALSWKMGVNSSFLQEPHGLCDETRLVGNTAAKFTSRKRHITILTS